MTVVAKPFPANEFPLEFDLPLRSGPKGQPITHFRYGNRKLGLLGRIDRTHHRKDPNKDNEFQTSTKSDIQAYINKGNSHQFLIRKITSE